MEKIKTTRVLLILSMMLLAACSSSTSSDDDNEIDQLIAEVQSTTAAFHNIEDAASAGWSEDISGCVEHPEEGGMGHHFARLEFFDGRVNHLEPQVLLYEPLANGGFEFVGVEYIIPFEVLPSDAEPPVLFGQEYHQNEAQQIWALHVWTEIENPSGMFADFNPNVTCQYAGEQTSIKPHRPLETCRYSGNRISAKYSPLGSCQNTEKQSPTKPQPSERIR